MFARSHLYYSIAAQFCFAGLSFILNGYALAVMETAQAITFVLIFAVAQSYAPVHNSLINLTLASLGPRISNARREGYGILAFGWSVKLALAHSGLVMIIFLLVSQDNIAVALALFGFCLVAALFNFLRQWLFQARAFKTALYIDGSALFVAILMITGLYVISGSSGIGPALLLSIGTVARLGALIVYRSHLPSGRAMPARLARGFRMLHLRQWRHLALLSLANYIRQGLVYIVLPYTMPPAGVLLLRTADLLILPLRQISGGAIAFLVPLISRQGATSHTHRTTFLVAAGFGLSVAGLYLTLRWIEVGEMLPARFASVVDGKSGYLLALAFVTHLLAAAAIGRLRGTFNFRRLARSSILANGIGITIVVIVTYLTGDWYWGLVGFIGIDIAFLFLSSRNTRQLNPTDPHERRY